MFCVIGSLMVVGEGSVMIAWVRSSGGRCGATLFRGWLNFRINLASNWGSALISRSSVDPYVPPFE